MNLPNHKRGIFIIATGVLIGLFLFYSINSLKKKTKSERTALSPFPAKASQKTIVASTTSISDTLGETIVYQVVPSPTLTPTPVQIMAKGKYEYSGITTNIALTFPKDGGNITGDASGQCNGSLKGKLDRENNKGTIQNGTGNGKCKIGPIEMDSTVNFSGNVYFSEKKVDISFSGKAGIFPHEGKLTLYFVL